MNTNQKALADLIIRHLNTFEVDGETMEYIVNGTMLEHQMLKQLVVKASDFDIINVLQEREEALPKQEYMGVSGKVSHDPKLARKYNALLEMLGTEGLLHQIEQWMDDSDLKNIVTDIENNIF